MRFSFFPLLQRLAFAGLLGLAATPAVQAQPNANGAPNDFVLAAANEALDVLKADGAVKAGNTARINQVVNEHILPYVNFQKTTRLAAGRYWRQATEQQRTALADAFRGTLVRTYSGALTRVTSGTTITALPFRGDPKADDAVVRTLISQPNGQPVGVDYRLEKTPQGWKIYDMNVEGIWLIENYRNQFAQQINQNGIDGLIQALNQRNQ
ncbi:ABC transporter substrate-binding protein [Achromobacter sp. SIMBA_011]|jgi:phospholipid transport system substrate-binding protein|uniref:Intermembrane phospholipid transport system binding protein MlaC n=1 Tax=Achromobacter dolens TaxID=1287738 RepID=A0A6S7CMC1_9BURK|nr:ABC transporter substrate-binding protein [Achromobacter dolens]MBQ2648799.1 ABC transporter substrate-binding protein [Achromobacter sp.]OAS95014.1 ABC transporter [Achromobacter xylosoxidans]MCZ8411943.1 ABC transporter substrate-binding protein [Achromobacter dolens]CAB3671107.1 Intermembrane phospholipid transport system binding protein MlaC [Achromobacter dolens]CAB3855199.1 Intermembrane phospholipid transport system binding protein MlaC [Achromobacter dolens]